MRVMLTLSIARCETLDHRRGNQRIVSEPAARTEIELDLNAYTPSSAVRDKLRARAKPTSVRVLPTGREF
jgi:hypothetical protein